MRNFILSPNLKNSVKASLLSLIILIASLNFGCCLNASADNDFPFWETNMYVTVNLSNDIDDETFMEDLKRANVTNSWEIARERFSEDLAKQHLYFSTLSSFDLLYSKENNGVEQALNDLHHDIKLPFGMIDLGSYYAEVGSPEKHPYDEDRRSKYYDDSCDKYLEYDELSPEEIEELLEFEKNSKNS